jgi:ADP-ribosylation factor protein 6
LSPEDITQQLQLTKLKDRLWYVAPSVATDGTGIFEGLVSFKPFHHLSFPCSETIADPHGSTSQAWLSNNVKTQPAK